MGTTEEAIAYLLQQKAADKKATPEWMFDDCAEGWFGIHALDHLDPLRWSGEQSLEKSIKDLADVLKHHRSRPIRVKVPADTMSFKTTEEASGRRFREHTFVPSIRWLVGTLRYQHCQQY